MVSVILVVVSDAAIINVVVEVSVIDVEISMVVVIVIVLNFALSASCSVDVPSSEVDVDLFIDALAGTILGVLPGLGIEALADVNAIAFAVVMTALEFPMPTTLEEFSC